MGLGKKKNLAVQAKGPTYIGNGMKIEGRISCSGPVRIDGEVEGHIECDGTLAIGSTAKILASVHANRVAINGYVEGSVSASEQLEVLPEGHILGNVSNPKGHLVIHEGAVIEGKCLSHERAESSEAKAIEGRQPQLELQKEPA